MHTVMVPLDGSAFAEQALVPALDICRRSSGQLHVVMVRASIPLADSNDASDIHLRAVAARLHHLLGTPVVARTLTSEYAPLHQPPPPPGVVADTISRYVGHARVDLVVMTTHGRGGLQRSWLGSVTDVLTRIATVPVFVLRPDDATTMSAADRHYDFRHILIPLDGSAAAERAIPAACSVGDPFDARYTLIRVLSPLAQQHAPGSEQGSGASPYSRIATLQYLEEVAARVRSTGRIVDTRVLDDTSPAAAICAFASAHAFDLIALTSSGSSGVRRMLIGSVADKVMRTTEVPTLLKNAHVDDDAAAPTAGVAQEAPAAALV